MINDTTSVPNVNIPFAHVVHSSARSDVLKPVLNSIGEHIGKDLIPKWVLVDDSDAEIAAVEASYWGLHGCKVALCVWHVKRAWLINIIKCFPGRENYNKRVEVFAALQALQAITARSSCLRARPVADARCRIKPMRSGRSLNSRRSGARRRRSSTRTSTRSGLRRASLSSGSLPSATRIRRTPRARLRPTTALSSFSLRAHGTFGFYKRVLQACLGFTTLHSLTTSRPAARSRRMANRRLDWLIYTIMERIVPYYVRKYVRRERKTCTSDLMAYIHELRAADVAAAATSQPAARPAAAVRAPRARPIAAPKRVDLAGLWAELQAALSAAHDAGVGAAADADASGFLKNAIYAAQCKVAEAGAAAPQPLLKNPGDDSLVCGVPAALGGNRGKKRSRAQSKPAAADGGDAPPQKLLPANVPGKAKKPKPLHAQLLATPARRSHRRRCRACRACRTRCCAARTMSWTRSGCTTSCLRTTSAAYCAPRARAPAARTMTFTSRSCRRATSCPRASARSALVCAARNRLAFRDCSRPSCIAQVHVPRAEKPALQARGGAGAVAKL